MAGTLLVRCARGLASLHRIFPAPWGFGRLDGDLGGGTLRPQKQNSACAGPENKTPQFGVALYGEFVTGPGQVVLAVQSGNRR